MGTVPTLAPLVGDSVLVGTFNTRKHDVAGTMYALNTRQIELRNFFFDGRGIGKFDERKVERKREGREEEMEREVGTIGEKGGIER